jgi:DNA gyrase inhibitor GyrI
MAPLDVRIETLPPQRVAVVRVTSATPEADAWRTLKAWAAPRGLLDDPDRHPVWGYTSQPPAKDGDAYGYEFWIGIDPGTVLAGAVEAHQFEGGTYAVVTVEGPPDPSAWKRLWDWVRASPYRWRDTHELERPRNPLALEREWGFDLYLPIDIR